VFDWVFAYGIGDEVQKKLRCTIRISSIQYYRKVIAACRTDGACCIKGMRGPNK
jgi:hypothetical protein